MLVRDNYKAINGMVLRDRIKTACKFDWLKTWIVYVFHTTIQVLVRAHGESFSSDSASSQSPDRLAIVAAQLLNESMKA